MELLDLTGIDTNVHAASALCEVFGERFRPLQVLRQLAAVGLLERKSGKAFHDYTNE